MKRSTIVAPIEQPVPVIYGNRPWFRIRRICFTVADWQAFDAAMRIACPYVRYFRDALQEEKQADTPPPIALSHEICTQWQLNNRISENWVHVIFDPGWPLEWVPPRTPLPRNNGILYNSWLNRHAIPLPLATIRDPVCYRSASGDEPEYYWPGRFDLSIEPNNEGHVVFARALFSLLGKLSSNRHQQHVAIPEGYTYDDKVTSDLWLGHEAIRWALADPNRVFEWRRFSKDGEPLNGAGIRPIAEKWRKRLETLGAGAHGGNSKQSNDRQL